MRSSKSVPKSPIIESYEHPTAQDALSPDVGVQAQFKRKKPPKTYRYDSSLAPQLQFDGQNPSREEGEALIAELTECGLKMADVGRALAAEFKPELLQELGVLETRFKKLNDKLKRLSRPFLEWTGKAERLSFTVPTLPLFTHERLSTEGIIETLRDHKRDEQLSMIDYFGDPRRSITDQLLRPYEHGDWANQLILGDSLVVMNSLLQWKNMGGQVQMIYIDPPYGVKFGSNFQPFVRRRDVSHNDDDDMTREPEMVQAYRDTWELGLHSYLTYLRDRLLLSREMLTPSGSIFVQISDDNLHHVREVMDEVFGEENFVSQISFKKTTSASGGQLSSVADYLLWYSKEKDNAKINKIYLERLGEGWVNYNYVRLPDGTHRRMTATESANWDLLPQGARVYRRDNLTSQRPAQAGDVKSYEFEEKVYSPGKGTFKTDQRGLRHLEEAQRLEAYGSTLSYRRFAKDFPFLPLNNLWEDTSTGGYAEERFYVVQTNTKVVQRCMLMTTDPGDLVLDPTCGSGTTAYVAEQWGRRWITVDTSRVPLALTRQRLLTATFPFYELKNPLKGPADGFVYRRKQNKKGEEVGGLVPHITLKSIANNEPPDEEILVDRPEIEKGVLRVCGKFTVEATIPTPLDWDEAEAQETDEPQNATNYGSFVERMLEVLRQSPILRLSENKTIVFKNVRPPARSLHLSAEAIVENGEDKNVAFVFGPENGAVSENTVYQAIREANAKNYSHLYVIGFAIQPNARKLIEDSAQAFEMSATYVQATPDLLMGDLLKNMRSSQIFSVAGLPEINFSARPDGKYEVELVGLDTFDPATMESHHEQGRNVPAWFLDPDYNDRHFQVKQAFFPATGAWENLKKALKAEFHESVWEHLSGTVSAPFSAGEHRQIAVKVIDYRGNELMVVRKLEEAQ